MNHKKGLRSFETFHGRRPKRIIPSDFHIPTHLILLGDAVEIVYKCRKFNGGGDGKTSEYIHKFRKGAKLYMDERSGKVLYISGNKIRVNDTGIVN